MFIVKDPVKVFSQAAFFVLILSLVSLVFVLILLGTLVSTNYLAYSDSLKTKTKARKTFRKELNTHTSLDQ